MEISTWELFLILKLDDLRELLLAFGFIGGVISALIGGLTWNELPKRFSKDLLFASAILLFLFIPIGMFLPSTKQMATLLVLPKIISNKNVQELPDKLLTSVNYWLEELKTDKK